METKIKEMALSLGADVCGIAHIDRFSDAPKGFHPQDIWADCKSVVVIGVSIPKGVTLIRPRLIYGHFNYMVCPKVDSIEAELSKWIEHAFNAFAIPLPCDGPYEYWDADRLEGRGLISMKHAAVQAGLGTLGKNTLLLNKTYGNLLTVGAILTNLDLQSDPLAQSICLESCHMCIKSCPVQALTGTSVIQQRCRPHTYQSTNKGFDTVECNKCRTVCPMRFGQK